MDTPLETTLDPWDNILESTDKPLTEPPKTYNPADVTCNFNLPHISSLIPPEAVLFGLDPSKTSSGVFYYDASKQFAASDILPKIPTFGDFSEVLSRRHLKNSILEYLGGAAPITHLGVEDAYHGGKRSSSARILYAINSAIDEVVLDCPSLLSGVFQHIPNTSWKSAWVNYTGMTHVNTYSDAKKGIQALLRYSPWDSQQSCYDFIRGLNTSTLQDRLDAFGCVISMFLGSVPKPVKVNWSKVVLIAHPDQSKVVGRLPHRDVAALGEGRVTKNSILSLLSTNPDMVFCSSRAIYLGVLTPPKYAGKPVHVAFWRKK